MQERFKVVQSQRIKLDAALQNVQVNGKKVEAPDLDPGEKDLLSFTWDYAQTTPGVWYLAGPDRALVKVCLMLGERFRERMVSLEKLLKIAGLDAGKLQNHFKEAWLTKRRTEYLQGVLV